MDGLVPIWNENGFVYSKDPSKVFSALVGGSKVQKKAVQLSEGVNGTWCVHTGERERL